MPKPRQFPILDELTLDKVNHALRLIQEGASEGSTRKPHSSIPEPGGSGAGSGAGSIMGAPTSPATGSTSNVVMNRKPLDMPPLVLANDGDEIIAMEYYETTGVLEVGSGADLYVLGWR